MIADKILKLIETSKKYGLIVLSVGFILISCVPTKDNIHINTGTDYGYNPPKWTIGCRYDIIEFKAIDKLIKIFGDKYDYSKTDFDERYKWEKIICKSLDKKPIDIILLRRIETVNSKDGDKRKLESITLYISKNDKDFLGPLKLIKRYKTKKFLNNLIDK